MRKSYYLTAMLLLLIVVGAIYIRGSWVPHMEFVIDQNIPYIEVCNGETRNEITLWTDNETGYSYFFLPSHVKTHDMRVKVPAHMEIAVDGQIIKNGADFSWKDEQLYQMEITDGAGKVSLYWVEILRSANIPTAFINTESGSMDYLLEDKQNEEEGELCVVNADGSIDYCGELERISGRGNSTWMRYEKKPFAIRLPAEKSLCGLKPGEKWCLLALFREGSKMNNKFAMDMAEQMGLQYTPQGTWVDLYMNGEYEGIYLLTEAITVNDGRVEIYDLEEENLWSNQEIEEEDHYEEEGEKGYNIANEENITGGYLIEKDAEIYYKEEKNGFVTSTNNHFSVKWPKHASKEQISYISGCVENIEQKVLEHDPDIWKYLDKESFVKRMLLDEVSMDYDACVTSMYFYKEKDDDKLYSGPIWDYDIAFGMVNADDAEGKYVDYEGTILFNGEERNELRWYEQLYDCEDVQLQLQKEFDKMLPFAHQMINEGLDEYADHIRASVHMDAVRWWEKRDKAGWYEDYDANVRYMKFFLTKRMNCIGERLGMTFSPFKTPTTGEIHQVKFYMDGEEIKSIQVEDGTEIRKDQLPTYDESNYEGWRYQWGREKFRETIPVYDDMILFNDRLQGDNGCTG